MSAGHSSNVYTSFALNIEYITYYDLIVKNKNNTDSNIIELASAQEELEFEKFGAKAGEKEPSGKQANIENGRELRKSLRGMRILAEYSDFYIVAPTSNNSKATNFRIGSLDALSKLSNKKESNIAASHSFEYSYIVDTMPDLDEIEQQELAREEKMKAKEEAAAKKRAEEAGEFDSTEAAMDKWLKELREALQE